MCTTYLKSEKFRWYLLLFSVSAISSIVLIRNAWLNDDAYITFRVVDNFVNGYGLRWNVDERVQAYTNPLWLFVISAVYFFTREIYLTSIVVSMVLSLLAIFILICFHSRRVSQVLVVFSALVFSRSFIDYTTSGLENPLTYLIMSVFLVIFFHEEECGRKIFLLSLCASLSALNRLDTLLFYLPSLFYIWLKSENKLRDFLFICTGFLPLECWEVFSLVYYGFPFPNTAYAKLNNYVERRELLCQGYYYFKWMFDRDPSSLLVIFLGVILPILRRDLMTFSLSAGMLWYAVYVLWIGGDFMGGRFFSAMVLFSVFVIAHYDKFLVRYNLYIFVSLVFIGLSISKPFVPIFSGEDFGKDQSLLRDETGIGNDRMYYYQITGLLNWERGKLMPKEDFVSVREGISLRNSGERVVKVYGCIGFRGFFAGPKVHIIDYWALADPLLSRLPPLYKPKWMIGHFWRYVPEGYVESVMEGENRFKDRNLGMFYEKLKVITQGPIWSVDRWREIIKVNLGLYDGLIDEDYYRFAGIESYEYGKFRNVLRGIKSGSSKKIPKRGLGIKFPSIKHFREIRAELKRKDKFYFLFFNGCEYLGKVIVDASSGDSEFSVCDILVPTKISNTGFDKLRVFVYPRDVESRIRRLEIIDSK